MTPHAFNSLTAERRSRRQHCHNICRQFARSPSPGNLKRVKQELLFCGDEVFIEGGFQCDYGEQIHISDQVYINHDCLLLDSPIPEGRIEIGASSLIGPRVQFLATSHPASATRRHETTAQPIVLEPNVWVGAGVILLGGITLGQNSVIGAGSVVTRSVPANRVFAGNPAKDIGPVPNT